MRALASTHRRLQGQLDRLAALAAGSDDRMRRRVPAVSGWSAVEHVEHLVRSDRAVLDGLERLLADPSAGRPRRLNLVGRLVLGVGRIPHGRGKAPETTRPAGLDAGELRAGVAAVAGRFAALAARGDAVAGCRTGFPHPYFGVLDAATWLRFVVIHHDHHLRIVDRLRAAP